MGVSILLKQVDNAAHAAPRILHTVPNLQIFLHPSCVSCNEGKTTEPFSFVPVVNQAFIMKGTQAPMIFEEYENRETFVEKYKRRIIQNPFLSVGLAGLCTMLVIGARKYRKLRADGMSPSVFLINLRVAAQGMVAGALGLGLLSQFVSEHAHTTEDNSSKKP